MQARAAVSGLVAPGRKKEQVKRYVLFLALGFFLSKMESTLTFGSGKLTQRQGTYTSGRKSLAQHAHWLPHRSAPGAAQTGLTLHDAGYRAGQGRAPGMSLPRRKAAREAWKVVRRNRGEARGG